MVAIRIALIGIFCAFPTLSLAAPYEWELPSGFPTPLVPADNPMNAAKVELGERLFFDGRLSLTSAYSCASCHDPARAFTDGLAKARGATGESHARNTPTLVNVAYAASLGWLDEGVRTLEAQHRIPLFNDAPIELGFDRVASQRLSELREDPGIAALVPLAFDGLDAQGLALEHVLASLASYVRTLNFADSPFDLYLYWGEPTLSDEALAGLDLFLSARTGCSSCHGSFNLSGPVVHERAPEAKPEFHGGIRAPTLRNVALTGPYMHDGSVATLAEVLDLYSTVGRGHALDLTAEEKSALEAFLESLTDLRWCVGSPRADDHSLPCSAGG